jgi:hypothetical protein
MYSLKNITALPVTGCPIQKSSDLSSLNSSPKLFAVIHVFLRLLAPRHPPYALNYLPLFLGYNLNTGIFYPSHIPFQYSFDTLGFHILRHHLIDIRSTSYDLHHNFNITINLMTHHRYLFDISFDIFFFIYAFPIYSIVKELFFMEVNGIEPMASCVQGRRSPI